MRTKTPIQSARTHLTSAMIAAGLLFATAPVTAANISFDTLVTGVTSFSFDGDGDGTNDATFSTTDPFGFNRTGPGANMSYITEPGLEGTTALSTDLRVDFLRGAEGPLQFGFAVNHLGAEGPLDFVVVSLFDAADVLLARVKTFATLSVISPPDILSDFPEARATVAFSGVAAYALFDFSSTITEGRFIIDDFSGVYGSTERPDSPVPAPGTWYLLGTLLAAFPWVRRHAGAPIRMSAPG